MFGLATTIPMGTTPFTHTMSTRIPVRSRRQAMDWSLVLVSQGIDSTVEVSEEAGWGLVVAAADYERSLAVLRQYRLENLHWPWRQQVHRAVLFDWGSLAWVFLLGAFYWLDARAPGMHAAGVMDGEAVAHGQWWRLVTAMFLHADPGHLAANAGFGLIFLGLAMGSYGTGVGLLATLAAGVGGNLMAWFIDPGHRNLGASGMVMGCLGLLVAQSLSIRREHPRETKAMLAAIAAGVMLFLWLGSNPGTDLVAHLGGFVSGLFLGAMLKQVPRLVQSAAVNFVAGVVFGVLVIVPWWLALRASG